MAGSIVLHAGAREVSFDQVDAVIAPPATATWNPVPHGQVYRGVETTLRDAGYGIEKVTFALSGNDQQFFATLDLTSRIASDVALSIGVRNSINQTLPLGFVAGSRVFVCDNLAFSGELSVKRKHTTHGNVRFGEAISLAISGLAQYQQLEVQRHNLLTETTISDDRAYSLILQALERKIIGPRCLERVLAEWRTPRHDVFRPRTAWSLFNGFTEALKEYSLNPQSFSARTIALNGLLCPVVNEGPADIEAQFTEATPVTVADESEYLAEDSPFELA